MEVAHGHLVQRTSPGLPWLCAVSGVPVEASKLSLVLTALVQWFLWSSEADVSFFSGWKYCALKGDPTRHAQPVTPPAKLPGTNSKLSFCRMNWHLPV